MKNPFFFEAGKVWTSRKTQVFNLLFSRLRVSFDWRGGDLDFLLELPKIRSITIESNRTIDISAIGKCKLIKEVILECKLPKGMSNVFLDELSDLRLYIGLDDERLHSLYRNKFIKRISVHRLKSSNLVSWQTASIEHIQIDDSPDLTSLEGIEKFDSLKLVEISNCQNLKRPTLHSNDYPFLRIYVDGKLQ